MASVGTRSSIKIAHGAVICKDCELRGDITIGNRTVIHPTVRIIAEAGPIIIGESNLIEEQVQIVHRAKKDSSQSAAETVMIIGNNNVFEVGSYSESLKIGDNNVLESKAKVGQNTELTSGCVIGAMCEITTHEVLSENTVIYGRHCGRRVQNEKPAGWKDGDVSEVVHASQSLQLDFLKKILPNYHNIRKPSKPEQ